MEVVMNEGLGGFKNQGDYEEREREFKRVSDEHLKKYRSGELPFQKQKKADQAQEFLKKHPRKKRTQKEQVDLYDIILSHLLDEGYAETPEAAKAIMVNMSEDWREDIMEISDRKVDAVGRRRQANVDKAMSSDEYIFDKPGATQKLATEISKKTRFNYLNKKRERRRG